jgi:hypothetical protein
MAGGTCPTVAGEREVGAAEREPELDEALAVDGLAGDDGDAELLFQPGDPHGEAGLGREVHHVQHEDDGPAEIEDLVHEVEITLEVGRIDDAQDAIRLWGVGAAAEQHVAGHGLVGRAGRE